MKYKTTIVDDDDLIESRSVDISNRVSQSEQRKCIEQDFGMCNSCSRFFYMQYELGEYEAYCRTFGPENLMPRSHTKRVEKCTGFDQKGQMSIWDMKELAWDIIKQGKEIKGFKKDED